jgi:predicted transcriptional regulator
MKINNLKSKVLKFMASNKDADLIDREGVQNQTALRTAKALRLEPQEAKKVMEILVEDGLAEKRSGKYCGATRYWITSKGREVAGL